ncbi:NADP-dependent succinic semialdehyde dehydrogenase [Rhizobium sp. UPM1132]|uniref:NAD-dependent succinate-semialdehyde dehydrogenase n=1 Tax=Rhizobium ruizarguesonis TaxID=2081791 RepID=UPI0014472C8F|nr:NAD-dependent succinate-semialdehyde dehydrogenase [Rhizobium ruizarguesonis]NKQ69790.1 NADP-dependent succinic semialdehyde dehydrogenase [Rhizobium ruizarguesonis]
MIITVDPSTGREIEQLNFHTDAFVDERLTLGVKAQSLWRKNSLAERARLLVRIAEILRSDAARLAALITVEMGKPISEATAEIAKCAWNCEHYAENAEKYLQPDHIEAGHRESFVAYEPIGIVLAIMPWNYPFWQVFRFLAPALAAGNGVVLKHAPNTSRCALAAQEVFEMAGGMSGLFSTLLIDTPKVRELIEDPRIAAITLTGSTNVGSIVGAQAAGALKKQVLELGGSDPFIVLGGADVQKAAKAAVRARFSNAGQACINAKRFIVEEDVANEFVEVFVDEVSKLVLGDPNDPETTIGPMARFDLRQTLHRQVLQSIDEGAVLKIGGGYAARPGYYYEPTVLDDVKPHMNVFREETFGPVAAIIRVSDAEEAIELANATEYGLGASLWSTDLARARQLALRIDAGAVFVNSVVGSDPRLPFGGVKRSGYGRELGEHGIKEFTNAKTIVVNG